MSVLYMGDDSLKNAASYLAGVMKWCNLDFDYAASAQKCTDTMLNKPYNTIILSDYPSANFTPVQLKQLKTKVEQGMGLVMLGGWDSFTGLSGDYGSTILSEVLPVVMQKTDDRVNTSSPCVVEKSAEHAIVASLPLATELPGIGGFNRVTAKPNTVTVLSVRQFSVSKAGNVFTFNPQQICPLLVVGACGKGRVAAFMSDVAPHWVGGMVDWGQKRLTVNAAGASQVQIGEYYATLFANIIRWTANIEF